MNVLEQLVAEQMRKDLPRLDPGDTVRVYVKIVEGGKERIQVFEGIVIRLRGTGISRSVTVRKVFQGVGVERVFPLHSPRVDRFEVVRKGRVRRAKLYYLRNLTGKAGRIKERARKSAAPAPAEGTAEA